MRPADTPAQRVVRFADFRGRSFLFSALLLFLVSSPRRCSALAILVGSSSHAAPRVSSSVTYGDTLHHWMDTWEVRHAGALAPDTRRQKLSAMGYRAASTHPFLAAFTIVFPRLEIHFSLPCSGSKRRQHYGARLVTFAN